MGRGKKPSDFTIRMLWAKSAGMCEYPGCQERLYFDNTSASRSNFAYVAHIVASSPDGPRGDKNRSYELSDKFDNLLLLCNKHHSLIDGDTKKYTESTLIRMKEKHEKLIDYARRFKTAPQTQIVILTSPIHGQDVEIQASELYPTFFPNRVPCQEDPIRIRIDEIQNDRIKDRTCWKLQEKKLKDEFNVRVMAFFDSHPDICCDLFALAPIPLLARFGDLLGNKRSVFLHHKQRTTNTWEWKNKKKTIAFTMEEQTVNETDDEIVLALSLSENINVPNLSSDIKGIKKVFEIKVNNPNTECVKCQSDIDEFIRVYNVVLSKIHNTYSKCSLVHVIAAAPAVIAIEIGRQRMRNVHPKLVMYNAFNGHYINTGITIGDE